jgi:hypothetical protein
MHQRAAGPLYAFSTVFVLSIDKSDSRHRKIPFVVKQENLECDSCLLFCARMHTTSGTTSEVMR